jgi:hypothetical protein
MLFRSLLKKGQTEHKQNVYLYPLLYSMRAEVWKKRQGLSNRRADWCGAHQHTGGIAVLYPRMAPAAFATISQLGRSLACCCCLQ